VQHRGLWLLDDAELVNILCIPPLSRTADPAATTWDAAVRYARQRRAFLIVDPPATWTTATDALNGLGALVTRDESAALYFPRITAADPLTGRPDEAFAPCGAVAGVYARTDMTRGVWKAPAGTDASLTGVSGLTVNLTSAETGQLNPEGINCLRELPLQGHVVWGARTLQSRNPDWKYVPVRRLALLIEEALWRGTQWAVFEPNAEPLWTELRLNIAGFMNELFRQGAFQGSTARDAYFVKCDVETTAQSDVEAGRVNVLVGFAAVKPAEFVILRLAVLAASPVS
jgi:uncharacterized protein